MKMSKLILPAIIAIIIAIIYFTYFAPSNELGSFNIFTPGSEINQRINVRVVKSQGFERDDKGNIISFFAADKNDIVVRVTAHEPILPEIANAEVIELLGHMHGNSITTSVFKVKE